MNFSAEKERLVSHDEVELFKKLYVTYTPDLVATATRYVGVLMAEDLVQELFLKVWDKKLFLHVKTSELGYFLFASLKNSCLDALKHEDVKQGYADYYKKELMKEILSCPELPFYYSDENESLDTLFKAVNRLPPKCREIFMDSYMNGKKVAEIAQEKDISKRTVEAQLYKALKILRRVLTVSLLFFCFW